MLKRFHLSIQQTLTAKILLVDSLVRDSGHGVSYLQGAGYLRRRFAAAPQHHPAGTLSPPIASNRMLPCEEEEVLPGSCACQSHDLYCRGLISSHPDVALTIANGLGVLGVGRWGAGGHVPNIRHRDVLVHLLQRTQRQRSFIGRGGCPGLSSSSVHIMIRMGKKFGCLHLHHPGTHYRYVLISAEIC